MAFQKAWHIARYGVFRSLSGNGVVALFFDFGGSIPPPPNANYPSISGAVHIVIYNRPLAHF